MPGWGGLLKYTRNPKYAHRTESYILYVYLTFYHILFYVCRQWIFILWFCVNRQQPTLHLLKFDQLNVSLNNIRHVTTPRLSRNTVPVRTLALYRRTNNLAMLIIRIFLNEPTDRAIPRNALNRYTVIVVPGEKERRFFHNYFTNF